MVTELLLLSNKLLARLLVRQIISGLIYCICVVVSTYTALFVVRGFWTFYGSEK